MFAVEPSSALALVAALLLMLTLRAAVVRRRNAGRRPQRAPDSSLPRFVPQAVRVLTVAERRAHTLLRQALPGYLVLAQVPVTRFLRVDTQQSEWLQLANGLSVDMLVCDSGSRVLAVVDVRSARSSDGSRRRHDKMNRLLKAAGIKVLSWNEDALPDVTMIRNQILPLLTGQAARSSAGTSSRPMPLIPVAEVLAEGDADHADSEGDSAMEPVPSALFDEFAPDLPLPAKR